MRDLGVKLFLWGVPLVLWASAFCLLIYAGAL